MSDSKSTKKSNENELAKPIVYSDSKWKMSLEFDVPFWTLTALSFLSRFWRLEYPRQLVLDELVYGNFVAMYAKRQFFFDKGPPLGKQLIALAAYVAGYDGEDKFARVGEDYLGTTPLWHLRSVSALCGSLTIPLMYKTVKLLGYSDLTAIIAGCLILFDTAFLTVSRFILLESILIFFCLLSLYFTLRFTSLSLKTACWRKIWLYASLTGLAIGMASSVKYFALTTCAFCIWYIAFDFWQKLDDRSISASRLIKYSQVCLVALGAIPLFVHFLSWGAHVGYLNKAGAYDQVMSSKFQSSLDGGLLSLTQGQPYNISYGSQITLRSVMGIGEQHQPCWLHSHADTYPVKYDDDRGSSHQQQVTCYGHKDANNVWIVKHPERVHVNIDNPIEAVKDGDVVQIIHGLTGRMLNSHDVAGPVTPEGQEVSCYIDYNISMKAEPNWIVKVIDKSADGDYWHPVTQQFQLLHETTKTVLSLSGQTMPEWAYRQQEVIASRQLDNAGSAWLVEEHRFIDTKLKDETERKAEVLKLEMIPQQAVHMNFFDKMYEVVHKVVMSRKESAEDHIYSSTPFEWLTMTRGVAFWINPVNHAQIYLIGNVFSWYTVALSIFLAVNIAIGAAVWLQYKYACDPRIIGNELVRPLNATHVFLGAYLFTYIPHYVTDNSLFVSQYLQALVFGYGFLAIVSEEILQFIWRKFCKGNTSLFNKLACAALGSWALAVIYVFFRYVGFSYGLRPFSDDDLRSLEWKDTWDFIKRQ